MPHMSPTYLDFYELAAKPNVYHGTNKADLVVGTFGVTAAYVEKVGKDRSSFKWDRGSSAS